MPTQLATDVKVQEVKAGDVIHGRPVTRIKPMNVNVELTFADGKTKRLRRDSILTVTREVPTYEEKRFKLSEQLAYAIRAIVETAKSAVHDNGTRDNLATSTNLLYDLQWKGVEILKELHTRELWMELAHYLDGCDDEEAVINEFMARLRERQLDWSPANRSTSPMHNLSDDCKYVAMQEFGSRWTGAGPRFKEVVWYREAIDKLDAEHNEAH